MQTANKIRIGYLVRFKYKQSSKKSEIEPKYGYSDHKYGYLNYDRQTGYNYFGNMPDSKLIYQDPTVAVKDLASLAGMKTFYDADKIDFESAEIVEFSHLFEIIPSGDIELESAKSKLTKNELNALWKHFQEEM